MPSEPRQARGDSKSRSNAATCRSGTLSGTLAPELHADGIGVEPFRYPFQPALVSKGTPEPIQISCDSPVARPFSDCADENSDSGAFARNSPKPPRITAAGGPLGLRTKYVKPRRGLAWISDGQSFVFRPNR